MIALFDKNPRGEFICVDMANKSIKDKPIADSILYRLFNNASKICEETERFKKALGENFDIGKAREILA